MSHGDRFFRLLGILLFGYAVFGKGFAYLGAGPVFVGELVLCYGIYALGTSHNWSRVLRTAWFWPLLAFMGWCALRTAPFIRIYGADALRDAAVWIWGGFAIVVASLLVAEPHRLLIIDEQFRKFGRLFLVIAPFTYVMCTFFDMYMPNAPWAPVPLILIKGGDIVVHLTGIFAYNVLLGSGMSSLFVVVATIIDLGLTFTGRAAMVTFGLGAAIVTMLRPKSPIVLGVFPTLLLGFVLLWLFDVHIQHGNPADREISATQVVQNVQSIFTQSDNENLRGSKEWRLLWWDTIIHYTFHGKYFWTGKGFGVNLADDDGFQVKQDGSLRSPHNGHVTMLARAGVPGLSLWILCHLIWAAGMIVSAWSAHRAGRKRWSSVFVVLLIYWAAFMTNAAFDVYLEGPLGGIWMWCVFGVGIGAACIYRDCPQTLADPVQVELSPLRKLHRHRRPPQIVKKPGSRRPQNVPS